MESPFLYSPDSAWERYSAKNQRKEIVEFSREYINFLSHCKTERETIAWIADQLVNAGFSSDIKSEKYLKPFRGKTLFAARRGSRSPSDGLLLLAAHGDSPRLDFKQHPVIEQAGIAQAKTHYYGGIRKYQWLARPLALHGVIFLQNGEKINLSIGEEPDEPVFCIADLLPHLSKKQDQQNLSDAFDAEKLNVILGHEPASRKEGDENKNFVKSKLLETLHDRYGLVEEDLITAEIEAVPQGKARFVGFDNSLIGAYGQDDRICAYCAMRALLDAENQEGNLALVIWDKEEIGSDGATGASSRFLEYCISNMVKARDGANITDCMLNSRAISADVTAALDPDFQDAHDPRNAARLGYGPCFSKFTGSRGKYGASEADAEYFSSLRNLFNNNNIPWQAAELGKVDSGGGGTVALFLAAYGMNVIDLGPALLSMHSPFELASSADLFATYQAYRCFMEQK